MRDKTKFAKRLKQCLVDNHKTITAFTKELVVGYSTACKWLNGTSMPTRNRLEEIADFFGVSMEWLSGEDVPKDKEIKRNASGYTDPTAFAAIKTVEKEGLKRMHDFRKGDIYEYTLQNGTKKYALVMSDERRSDPKTVAIFVLDEREQGVAINFRTSTMYAHPNRLSYGYIDNFGLFVKKIKQEEVEMIEKAALVEAGFSQKNIQYVENEAAEKIKQMVKALKTENEGNEKLIESLQNQIRTLTAECSQLSADSRRYESRTDEAELMKAQIERDLYKNLYEQAIERMIDR